MISLPVKYRPQVLDDVCGQDFVVDILKKQLATDSIKNAYLFCGQSGSGKTTVARCFAKAVNNGVGTPIEIDAASNNGVDNIRAIIQEAQERSLEGKYKIYIVDEVQAMTPQAWQAFLKCIEEPPALTIFILCTTDPQKIPETILNRVQRFNFNKIPHSKIKDRLQYVCEHEGIVNYEESIDYISRIVDGCMREALTLLGKVVDYGNNLSLDKTIKILGNFSIDTFCNIINHMIDGDEAGVLSVIDEVEYSGNDVGLFVNQLLKFVIDVSKYILFNTMSVTTLPSTAEDLIKGITNFDNPIKYYNYIMDRLLELKNMLKGDSDSSTTVRVVCLQMTRMS